MRSTLITIFLFFPTFLLSQINHNLYSPFLELPLIGEDETMHFGFWLYANMPDSDGDNDTFLDDYYRVAIRSLESSSWHISNYNSISGSNFWCSDEEGIGGYKDGWLQFLDTPNILIGESGNISVDIFYAIEDYFDASVDGSCTDGWDVANVRISIDDGLSWELLSDEDNPYDFQCGYGWIWNDTEYEEGRSLNHLASGWGGESDGWINFSSDLSEYANQNIKIRFAFGSDPAYSTIDDSSLSGFQIDNIIIEDSDGIIFSEDANNMSQISAVGVEWYDQFYDYGSIEENRPGALDWTFYSPGMPYAPGDNIYLDISSFAEKTVQFRIQTQYDNNHDGGQGLGLFIDDFMIYKIFSGYASPNYLTATLQGSNVNLVWQDMNLPGSKTFIYDNDNFSSSNPIRYDGWAGKRFDILGNGSIDSIFIYNANDFDTTITYGVFTKTGALYNLEPDYSDHIELTSGWNGISLSQVQIKNSCIIAYRINNDFGVSYDASSLYQKSIVRLGESAWEEASNIVYDGNGDGVPNLQLSGEFGIRSKISYDGANVAYNLYRDQNIEGCINQQNCVKVDSSILVNTYLDTTVEYNKSYEYAVTATYSGGQESKLSDSHIQAVTILPETVYELYNDDGSFESEFNAGSGNFSAVRFSAGLSGEDIVRFKWYQNGSGGAFNIKVFEDNGGMPGTEVFSLVQASGNIDGWNEKDLSTEDWSIAGSFWVGTKEFSSSNPFGLDTTNGAGNSYQRAGSSGDWVPVAGNLAYRIYLDCGDGCNSGQDRVQSDILIDEINYNSLIPIYSFGFNSKRVNKNPSLINGGVVYKNRNGLNRALIQDEIIPLIGFNFEQNTDNEILLTESWTYDDGWELSDALSAPNSPTHSFNSPDNILFFEDPEIIPQEYNIIDMYPNPFNSSININFNIAEYRNAKISIFDINGRLIDILIDQGLYPGSHSLKWDGTDVNGISVVSGIYFSVLEVQGLAWQSKKMVLLK